MKKLKTKIILCASLLLLLTVWQETKAQIQTSIGAGYNSNGYPVYELHFGYELHRINFNVGFNRAPSRSASTNIISGIEIGYNLLNEEDAYLLAHDIIISGGFSYVSENSDQKQKESYYSPSISLRYVRMLSEQGAIYGQITGLKNNILLTVGMLLKFN